MKIAWLECATGISGDMMLAACIDAGADVTQIRAIIDSLELTDVRLRVETVIRNGFRSLQVLVDHPEQHAHRNLHDIREILDRSALLSPRQKSLAEEMFMAVAAAEAFVHGSTIDHVHFHEVGAIDSIVDIVGVAVAFDLLKIDRLICNPVPPGRGFVSIAHGICPVPAPGTAELLKGIPLADIPLEAELTTPTGAAIVKVLADAFGALPAMTLKPSAPVVAVSPFQSDRTSCDYSSAMLRPQQIRTRFCFWNRILMMSPEKHWALLENA